MIWKLEIASGRAWIWDEGEVRDGAPASQAKPDELAGRWRATETAKPVEAEPKPK